MAFKSRRSIAGYWPPDPRVELAAGLVHDFNNLLSVIASGTEAALEALGPDHPASQDLQMVSSAIDHLSDLAARLLGLLHRTPHAGDLDDGARLMRLQPLLSRAVGPQIDLDMSASPGLRAGRLPGLDLERIVMNLVFNARNAIRGPGRIEVSLEPDATGVRLMVRDTGRGIPPHVQDRMFEAGVHCGTGTGLGLTVVHRAVTDAGGTIVVATSSDQGTCFTITLPAT